MRVWLKDKVTKVNIKDNSFDIPSTKGLYIYEVKASYKKGTAVFAFAVDNK